MEDQNAINVDAGKRLRLVRSNLGLSSREFAKELGVNQSQVIRYENGENGIPVSFLSALYIKYNVLPNFVAIGETPMFLGKNHKRETVTDVKQMKADILAMESKVRMISKKK